MVNIILRGLCALIALDFTVDRTYVVPAGGDNTVNRPLALNYPVPAAASLLAA